MDLWKRWAASATAATGLIMTTADADKADAATMPMKIDINAIVTEIDPDDFPSINLGDLINGDLLVTPGPDAAPDDPSLGGYQGVLSGTTQIGGVEVVSATGNVIIEDHPAGGIQDDFVRLVYGDSTLTAGDTNGRAPVNTVFNLYFDPSTLPSDKLEDLIHINDATPTNFGFSQSFAEFAAVRSTNLATTPSVETVPEPATSTILLLTTAGLFAVRLPRDDSEQTLEPVESGPTLDSLG